jgi:Kdo2-lipid IVA lauroyltransferase/acyltransferase
MLPLKAALKTGAALGWIAWKLLGIRKDVSLRNLAQAFPSADSRSIREMGLRSYMNAGRFMMEFARQAGMNEEYVETHVTVRNDGRLRELNKLDGALLITGHFGNWELFGITCRYMLGDVAFLVGRQSNPLVDDFINRMRSVHGIELYNRRSAVKGVLRSMRRGGYVCWLSDQDAGLSGITVDFFGYPASTPRGAAAFSVKLGVPVVPAVLVRKGNGPDHELVIGEAVRPNGDVTVEEAEIEVTQAYTRQLEDLIRERPDLYWWAHRRWKTTGFYSAGENRE